MFTRIINLFNTDTYSFFLWGPRQTGKSTLLKMTYPDALMFNLLDSDIYSRFLARPAVMREEALAHFQRNPNLQKFVVIDEIQKIPALTDEVHLLIENYKIRFCLCGSSARKLKKVHANMLGGRALRRELFGLVYPEYGLDFDLDRVMNRGILPAHYLSDHYKDFIKAYVGDYLKEEISAEGLVRNLPAFAQFLNAASFSDSEILVYKNIASDCGVSLNTVRAYFQILEDTLIGRYLPAYTEHQKRKVIHAPKFYYFNVALVNYLAKRGEIQQESTDFGKAFENWIFHELHAYNSYENRDASIAYWRLADSGAEVDFVINDLKIAIEVKGKKNIQNSDLKGIRELMKEHPSRVSKAIVVCLETSMRKTDDGIWILPYRDFLEQLWAKELF